MNQALYADMNNKREVKKKSKGKTNKQTKTTSKCPKFKCNTVSVSFSTCSCSSVVVSSKGERKKKRVWRQLCECLRLQLTCLLLPTCCCWRLY
jgi:hypothetical protein